MTAHSEDPRPCPFCGEASTIEAVLTGGGRSGVRTVKGYRASCAEASCAGWLGTTRSDIATAVAAWNRRAVPVEPPGVPPHDCEFTLNPEAGKCDLCELFAAGYERGYRAASTPEVMSTEAPTETP